MLFGTNCQYGTADTQYFPTINFVCQLRKGTSSQPEQGVERGDGRPRVPAVPASRGRQVGVLRAVVILCVRGVTSQWPAGCPGRTRRRSDRIIERRGSEAAGAAHASDAEYARACHGTRARTEWHQLCAADCVTTAPTVRFYRVALHHQYTRRRRAASRRTGDRRRRPGLAGCQPATPPVTAVRHRKARARQHAGSTRPERLRVYRPAFRSVSSASTTARGATTRTEVMRAGSNEGGAQWAWT